MVETIDISISKSQREGKRAKADITFDNGEIKTIHFGSSMNLKPKKTYWDGASDEKKKNYIARHRPRAKDWNGLTPGMFARYVLWSSRTKEGVRENLQKALKDYFKINNFTMKLKKYNVQNLIDADV